MWVVKFNSYTKKSKVQTFNRQTRWLKRTKWNGSDPPLANQKPGPPRKVKYIYFAFYVMVKWHGMKWQSQDSTGHMRDKILYPCLFFSPQVIIAMQPIPCATLHVYLQCIRTLEMWIAPSQETCILAVLTWLCVPAITNWRKMTRDITHVCAI